jgi:hypothetical protein
MEWRLIVGRKTNQEIKDTTILKSVYQDLLAAGVDVFKPFK